MLAQVTGARYRATVWYCLEKMPGSQVRYGVEEF